MLTISMSISTTFFWHLIVHLLFFVEKSYFQETTTNSTDYNGVKSCATVKLTSGTSIDLYENGILSREDYESVRDAKLKRATFEVVVPKCVLEICGFSETSHPAAREPYKHGTCELYFTASVRAPSLIYDPDYQVTSMSCACSEAEHQDKCNQVTCQLESDNWNGMQCAVLYQETNCQSCFFQWIFLEYGKEFMSLNSFQIKSIRVRKGCTVEQYTKGALGWDLDDLYPFRYTETRNDSIGVFHKDSENFTCYCDRDLLEEMRRATTTVPTTTTTTTSLSTTTGTFSTTSLPVTNKTTPLATTLSEATDEDTKSFKLELLIYILPAIGFVLLVSGLAFIVYFYYNRRHKNGDVSKNTQIEAVDKEAAIQMQELAVTNLQTDSEGDGRFVRQEFLYGKDDMKNEIKGLFENWLRGLEESLSKQWRIPFVSPISPVGLNANDALMDYFELVCDDYFRIEWERIVEIDKDEPPAGAGHFGLVYKGYLKPNHESDGLAEIVAIKTIKPYAMQNIIMTFLREIKIFQSLKKHENIVKYIGSACHNGQLYILTEFCENGSLRDYLKDVMRSKIIVASSAPESQISNNNANIDAESIKSESVDIDKEEDDYEDDEGYSNEQSTILTDSDFHQLLHWSEQIATGMEFLNSQKVIHVDLAVRNILLTSNLVAKICDFGLSKTCIEDKDYADSVLVGEIPVNYYAPDWVNNSQMREDGQKKVSVFIDVWAFGCTVWELFSLGERPYFGLDGDGIKDFLRRKQRLEKPHLLLTFLYKKLEECWSEMPEDRPSFTELKEYFSMERLKIIET
ncbi:unnamed protein product [Orchesella dallaii]